MKLLNRSLLYLSVLLLFIIGLWALVFYLNLREEIRDSIDDSLDHSRVLILQKVKSDSTLLLQNEFGGNNFEIQPISRATALQYRDEYKDTLMYRQNEEDLEPVRILHSAFEHQERYYHLKVISSLVEEDDLIEDAFWSVLWLFVSIIISIMLVNNLVFRKIWQPFYVLLGRLKNYRVDRDEEPIQVQTKTKEFVQLQEASNALILNAKRLYLSQKQFTENAAHELQTPIAVIINKLEILLESSALQAAEAQSIAEVIRISERLKRLNNSLLLLAKIENQQFLEEEEISLNRLSNKLVAAMQEMADFKHLRLQVIENAQTQVLMNPALAEVLISNLIRNAIFHNTEGGQVTITISEEVWRIANTGQPVALEAKRIFNRFEKDGTKRQSTGLGLAIAQAICKTYGLSLVYDYVQGEHCFTLNVKNRTLS